MAFGLVEHQLRRLNAKKEKGPDGLSGPFFLKSPQILVRREITRGVFDGGGGSSTVIDTSLLLRRTPSFTVFSSRLPASLSRRSPSERIRSPFSEVMTSPLF